jgi:hypothetical protein
MAQHILRLPSVAFGLEMQDFPAILQNRHLKFRVAVLSTLLITSTFLSGFIELDSVVCFIFFFSSTSLTVSIRFVFIRIFIFKTKFIEFY